MPRFSAGDPVESRKFGVGIVRDVFPAAPASKIPSMYAVVVDRSTKAVILSEDEIKAVARPADGAVRCRDCARGSKSAYTANTVRCSQFNQLRSAGAPRTCASFSPRFVIKEA